MNAAAAAGTETTGDGAVLGRLPDFPDREAVPVSYNAGGREVAVLVVRRGDALRAYLDLCPHVFLPLTWRGRKVLSADGERLRCSNHGAEFEAADGRGVSGPGSRCGLTPVPLRLDADGTVRVQQALVPPSDQENKERRPA